MGIASMYGPSQTPPGPGPAYGAGRGLAPIFGFISLAVAPFIIHGAVRMLKGRSLARAKAPGDDSLNLLLLFAGLACGHLGIGGVE